MGSEIVEQRALGQRHPEFKPERIPEGTFRFVMLQSGDKAALQQVMRAPRPYSEPRAGRARLKVIAAGVVAATVLTALTVGLSRFVYVAPPAPDSMLVVSFKHAGAEVEDSAEVETGLDHLKGMKRRTRRLPVRLRVSVDGELLLERAYEPRGIRGASASMATEEIALKPGRYEVVMTLGGSEDVDDWTHVERRVVEFKEGRRRVLRFDQGFHWDTD